MVKRAFWLQTSMQAMGPAQQTNQPLWTICRRHASLGLFSNECMWMWFRRPNLHQHPAGVPHLETTVSPHRSRQSPLAKLSTKLQSLTWVFFHIFSLFIQIYIVVILFLIVISAVNTELIWKTLYSNVVSRFSVLGRYSKSEPGFCLRERA